MKCIVCDNEIPGFVPRGRGDGTYSKDCPICSCTQRHRALIKNFSSLWQGEKKIIEVGAHRSMIKYFVVQMTKNDKLSYTPVDMKPFHPLVIPLDMSSPHFSMNPSHDVGFCMNVMQHVYKEDAMMTNFCGSIKVGGKLIFTAPLKEGETDRSGLTLNNIERLEKFGSETTFRKYGKADVEQFIQKQGMTTEVINTPLDEENGIDESIAFIVGTKL